MEPSLFKYIWKHTRSQQIWILAIILISMVPYFLSLDLPKRIVNGPIQGQGFPHPEATQKFFEVSISFPDWLYKSDPIVLFNGIDMERLNYLIALSLSFLAFVCINGLFKFYINTFKGRLGERMLRRLRYDLVDRVLRFPMGQFRRVKAPEMATMIKDEVEPLGGFIGDMLVQPVFLGGQALTAMIFIMAQNYLLGFIAGGIVALQAIFIPRLRRRLLLLGKERQITARALAGRVGEIVDGIGGVHTNDTSNYERADISGRLGRIFAIRYELFQRKFFIKFLNNLLAQITPFLFYLVGGYFAIRGSLDIGQLVAVIAAYKDLPGPIRDLIAYDQQRLDVQIKYGQVIEQFQVENLTEPELQEVPETAVGVLNDGLRISRIGVVDEAGAKLIESATFNMDLNERVAVVGSVNSGAETIPDIIARLIPPTSGSINLNSSGLEDLPESATGRRLGYASPDTYFRQGSFRESLLYSLMHQPGERGEMTEEEQKQRAWEITESQLSGNTTMDIHADWLDYDALGVRTGPEIDELASRVLDVVDLRQDVFDLGLRGQLNPEEEPELAAKFLQARAALRERLQKDPLKKLVEPFLPDKYSMQATLVENLLFGTAIGDDFSPGKLTTNDYFRSVLKETGIDEKLFEMGREIASNATELFKDLPPDHPFFEQLSFMTSEEIPEYETALARLTGVNFNDAAPADQDMLLRLPMEYVEPRHRFGLLDEDAQNMLLKARVAFRENLPEELSGAIAFYDPDEYNPAASLQDNILLGRIAYGMAEGPEKVGEEIYKVLDELELHDEVFQVGLNFNIGIGGKRLNLSQRQKLGLARAIMKNPDLLIVNRALNALDAKSQEEIMSRVLEWSANADDRSKRGVFWVLQTPRFAAKFDRALVFDHGNLVEDGKPEELKQANKHYAQLISAT
ncbi:MAG: ABC transporter transmembrane domain-containing protein [Hyphomicrobiales bacterium]